MKIHDLKPAKGSNRRGIRVGRGTGGRRGKTAGRGTRARALATPIKMNFEGGQMPLHMRVPKLKGFKNPFRVEYQAINLDVIEGSRSRRDHARATPRQGARPTRARS